MELFYIVVPILIVVLLYIVFLKVDSRGNASTKVLFAKLRIVFVCVGIGVLLYNAFSGETGKEVTRAILFSLIGITGVINLHRKYFSSKN